MPTRVQGRVDSGRRELGARVQNYHQPSADREGEAAPATDTPASILLTISTPPPVTLAIGATYQTTAVVYNAVGNVIPDMVPSGWQSSSPSVATVDGNGLVRGIAAGTVDITATLNAITSNALSITVVGALPDTTPASVTVSPSTLVLQSGAPQTLSAVIQNAAGTALALSPTSWVSSNIAVATVSNLGVVTWVGAGSASITARYNAIVSNACVVTASAVVDTTPSSVAISPTTLSLVTGSPQTLSAVVKNAAGTALAVSPTSWTSSDPTKATVNSSGVVTWVAAGTTTVRALYNAIQSNACVVTALVDANTVAASVVVTPATLTLQVSAPQTLSAVIKNSSGVALALTPTSWTSSNTGVATVNSSGVVTWVGAGTTNVAAHYNALDSNSCAVTALANPAVATSVVISPTTLSLQSGAPQTLTAVIKNANGTALALSPTSWTSSDTGKATVSASGVVTWVAAGTTNVAAHYNALDSNNCVVTAVAVSNVPASILIAPSTATIEAGRTQQLTALVKNAAGATLAGVSPSGWSSATPATCTVSSTGLVTGIAAGGPVNVTATLNALTSNACAVTVSASSAPTQDLVTVTLPTLMTTTVASTPRSGRTVTCGTAGALQAAFDDLQAGDLVQVTAGVTLVGNFTIVKGGTIGNYVWIDTSGSKPAEFTRFNGSTDATLYSSPRIRSLGTSSALTFTGANAKYIRIMGLDIGADTTVTSNTNGLIAIGAGDETSALTLPSNIIIDRCYIHGRAGLDVRRGVTNNGASISVIDSYINEIHSTSDSNGIAGWNGPGPYKIVNNYIQAAGVSIGSGGAHVYINGMIPSDWEVKRNYMTKDLSWVGTWVMKNNFEIKNGQRLLIEGNVFENSPADGQLGFAIILWSADQDGAAPWSTCNNVTCRLNVIQNTTAGMSLSAQGYRLDETEPMHHVAISNNVFIGINGPASAGVGQSYGEIFVMTDAMANLSIEHNTGFSPVGSTFHWGGVKPLTNHVIKNNNMGGGQYQLFNGTQGAAAWTEEAGSGSAFLGNIVALSSTLPAGNQNPNALGDIGLVGGAAAAYDPTVTPAALALETWSGYHHLGTDGTDPGADIAAVLAATSGVTSRW